MFEIAGEKIIAFYSHLRLFGDFAFDQTFTSLLYVGEFKRMQEKLGTSSAKGTSWIC